FHGWTWIQGGCFYGIPLSNFRDWFLVSFIAVALFLLVEKKNPNQSLASRPFWFNLPVIGYNFAFINNIAGCLQIGIDAAWVLLVFWFALTIATIILIIRS
ncbi:carotenoid biosynthesis protein, partial [bacterium]|nr:carotenoid biosynthesis protein [candidate division CSSED10-310 bacterium]